MATSLVKRPALSISGGNPAGFPDFRPRNPWGRKWEVPEGAKKRLEANPFLEPLFQIEVRDARGRRLRVFPKMPYRHLEVILMAINAQIALGNERTWSRPEIVPA